jgi:hypothetical protein
VIKKLVEELEGFLEREEDLQEFRDRIGEKLGFKELDLEALELQDTYPQHVFASTCLHSVFLATDMKRVKAHVLFLSTLPESLGRNLLESMIVEARASFEFSLEFKRKYEEARKNEQERQAEDSEKIKP